MKASYVLLTALLLSGCLVLAEAPPIACNDDAPCVPYACRNDGGCFEQCDFDSHCADDNVCNGDGECEPACVDSDCDNLLVCDRFNNVCLEECEVHDDCKGQKKCCKANGLANDLCDQKGTCY